jgi:hypothetical protein
MGSPAGADLDRIAVMIIDRLAEQGIAVPVHLVRDAVVLLLRQDPRNEVTGPRFDDQAVVDLVDALMRKVHQARADTATSPAVFTAAAVGQLNLALGTAVHLAGLNLDQDRLQVAGFLASAGSARRGFA